MPELPEVEVTRLGIEPFLKNETITDIRLGKPLRSPLLISEKELIGRKIITISRRGKYLILNLSQGILFIHLGMSGSLRFLENSNKASQPAAGKHDHFDLSSEKGTLRLTDPRRFGMVMYCESQTDHAAQKVLGKLGVEPFSIEFSPTFLFQQLKTRSAAIKQVLLSGYPVVGVGNIYASEVLFLARIDPFTSACTLSQYRIKKLHSAILEVLSNALTAGGSTLKNFVNANGDSGYFQLQCHVYGKAAQPCPTCKATIQQVKQGQRSTFYCPQCQK